ncbi:protein yippee-like 1 isoform X1 [Hippopotamus amphibius kiboko]|uniref:protein yippee-like 1 isoform X1 n=1 Tax=Hippopotamus amphibius kiboko TaxID=575201 RepID=UPI0025918AF1|nr:protein yippee-like 1 isoform X1 [Hippopotamus amphibius kiboko]
MAVFLNSNLAGGPSRRTPRCSTWLWPAGPACRFRCLGGLPCGHRGMRLPGPQRRGPGRGPRERGERRAPAGSETPDKPGQRGAPCLPWALGHLRGCPAGLDASHVAKEAPGTAQASAAGTAASQAGPRGPVPEPRVPIPLEPAGSSPAARARL